MLLAYFLVLIFPAGLLGLYALFRWRYLTAIRNAIYSPAVGVPEGASGTPGAPLRRPLMLRWTRRESRSEPLRLDVTSAWADTKGMRLRFLAAGAVYLIAAALAVWQGQRTLRGSQVAVALAYSSTLPALFVIVAFLRPGWRGWVLAATVWTAMAFLLLVGPLGVPWRNALGGVYSGVDTASFALACVGLVVLKRSRPLLVGFVPLMGLWLALTVAWVMLLSALGISQQDVEEAVSVSIVSWALAGVAIGLALGISQIRRGLTLRAIAALMATLIAGVVLGSTHPNVVTALITSIAVHALFVITVWSLFIGFLRLKAKGVLPDEVLHFSFCWFALTALLPAYAGSSSWLLTLTPFAAYAGTLFVLLTRYKRRLMRSRRHSPKRMLLLRVFSRTAMRSRLLDLLDDSWCRVGRIDLVVGVDLAVRTLSAAALENFLLGRVDRQFVRNVGDVDRHLQAARTNFALDSRYPLNELHCLPGVWQQVVSALARVADVVLMDLRGFQAGNRGIVYELSLVMRQVPLTRTVLLTDEATDERTLTDELLRAWSALPGDSPNAGLPEPRIDLVRCSGTRLADVNIILNRVFAAADVSCSSPPLRSVLQPSSMALPH